VVRAAPIDRYLKARGFDPPRTWVSGITEQLRRAGAGQFVEAARAFYFDAVKHMHSDLKANDKEGDNFAAWLRACHRNVYDDIDSADLTKLLRKEWAPSLSGDHRYHLRGITIPDVEGAFAAFNDYKGPSPKVSSAREQVLSKMIVDAYQLRLVDLAAILKVGSIVASSPEESKIVVVFYAGSDHTRSVMKFWRSWGFGATGLANKGLVGKEEYEEDEPRCLSLPSYLHDFGKLFPVPKSITDSSAKMSASARRLSDRKRA
jgi:hypothetical protein